MHIFASDYDGTLYKNEVIRPEELEAIEKFRSLGHKFGIVTGRNIDSIRHEIEKHEIPVDFLIGINGGVVMDHEGNQIQTFKIKEEIIDEIFAVIEKYDVSYFGVSDGYRNSQLIEIEPSHIHNENSPIETIRLAGVTGMYVGNGNVQKAQKLSDEINEKFAQYGVKSHVAGTFVDIGVHGVTKSSGIELLREHFGYYGEVFTVGDSFNDIPMLKNYNGFLMENGVRGLLEFAKMGLVDSVADAIARAIAVIDL